MLDHLTLTVRDIDRSIAFYTKALAPLGYFAKAHHEPTIGFGLDDGTPHSDFYVSPMDEPTAATRPDDATAADQIATDATPACPVTHIAFLADSPAAVRAFHTAALAAGGQDNGAPGPRAYHPGYYAAFVLDPDGNNIEAVTDWSGWPSATNDKHNQKHENQETRRS
ncbi:MULTISPECIES: VOC family protein [Bifidobacterium]|uniref:VOC family protein n=1 Tax=Bifidobacterium TaxID=1678 RepID=UPI001BDCC78B|nr:MULTISPECIES: VOC family protein [Bifidobacterium]MBT1162718.1 VOC family protein [Bifidobacterium sp. SO1]MBW3078694.1 VOC family protein [Bifidobacterium simiiventris]